jgi:putative NADH-flavin reductase
MKILVLGASGGVGKWLVQLACEEGHEVTALTRRADGIDSRATISVDDVLRPGVLDEVVQGQAAVVSALGLKRISPANPWSRLMSPPDFASRTATLLVRAMQQHGVKRVVAVSAAGVGESAPTMNFLMKFMVATSNVGVAYRDLAVMERIYAESGLEWCCPRPTRLTNGPVTRSLEVTDRFGMNSAISRADVAWWMLQQATRPVTVRTPMITGRK